MASVEDIKGLIDVLMNQFNVASIVSVIGIGIAAAAGLVFTYWGVRKIIGMIMNAFYGWQLNRIYEEEESYRVR